MRSRPEQNAAAGAGEDHDVACRCRPRPRSQRVVELDDQLDRHRVEPVGPVQRDDARVRLRLLDEDQASCAPTLRRRPPAGAPIRALAADRSAAVRVTDLRIRPDRVPRSLHASALPCSSDPRRARLASAGRRRARRAGDGAGGSDDGDVRTAAAAAPTVDVEHQHDAPRPPRCRCRRPPATMSLTRTVTGDISPKSVVASGRGLVFAQNMMYRHTITVYDRNGDLVKTIPDTVNLTDFGIPATPALQGAPVEAAFTPDGTHAYVSNYSMYGSGFGPEGDDDCPAQQLRPQLPLPHRHREARDRRRRPGRQGAEVRGGDARRQVRARDQLVQLRPERRRRRDQPRGQADPARPVPTRHRGHARLADRVHRGDGHARPSRAIDLTNFTRRGSAASAAGPRHLVLSPDGQSLYVTLNAEGRSRRSTRSTAWCSTRSRPAAHIDFGRGYLDRKISMVVQLSPPDAYEGGVLEFGISPPTTAARERGSLLAFPAWVPHRLSPITSGRRYVATCFVLGPPFR